MDESKQGNLLAGPGGSGTSKIHAPHAVQTDVLFAEHLDALGGGVALSIKERTRINSRFPDDLINAPNNEEIPAAIPGLIDAAVAVLDADRDTSRRYLLRASAILRVKPRRMDAESTRSESRGGLLAWQLNRIIDYIEMHLADKIAIKVLADLVKVSASQLFRAFKISVGVTPFQYIARRRVELACTLIRTTGEPLSQVAVACGLCDQAHLCKVFHRTIGMSPSAWRRAMSARDTAIPAS
jgi:AraC family transcriptional regulator